MWFGGSIAEAVNLSKQRNAIFVVFIEGDNDLSTEMVQVINDPSITGKLSDQSRFLAIKLQSGSTNYMHFAQMYQFVPVPSLFFIGHNGTPLDVVCAGVQADNLASRIDRISAEHANDKPQFQPSTQDLKEQSSSFLQNEASATQKANAPTSETNVTPSVNVTPAVNVTTPEVNVTTPAVHVAAPEVNEATPAVNVKTSETEVPTSVKRTDDTENPSAPASKVPKTEYEVVCVGDVCVRRKKDEGGPSTQPMETESLPEPTAPSSEESQASLEEKMRRAKELVDARKLEKAHKEKELEKQREIERRSQGKGVAELKKWQAEQELKQIQEERKREKLENQLARQRVLDQIAHDRAERRARDTNVVRETSVSQPASTVGDGSATEARLQFKLPDGTSRAQSFPPEDTLGTVRRYIADHLQVSASKVTLWTTFPRRELTDDDSDLRTLSLVPSAALIVFTRENRIAATPPAFMSFLTTFFSSIILEPLYQVYDYIRNRLFPRGPAPASTPTEPQDEPRPAPAAGLRYRQRSNIHRLADGQQNDEDNNTWNGNSTQQM